jgi:hypothetical protein
MAQSKILEIKPPMLSITPETPRSEERTAAASATNKMVIRMVNVLRLIGCVRAVYHIERHGTFVSVAAGRFCEGSIATTLFLSTNETRPLRLNQTP